MNEEIKKIVDGLTTRRDALAWGKSSPSNAYYSMIASYSYFLCKDAPLMDLMRWIVKVEQQIIACENEYNMEAA